MIFLLPLWLPLAALLLLLYFFLRTSLPGDSWAAILPDTLLSWLRGEQSDRQRNILALLAAAIITLALASPALKTDNEIYQHTQGWLIVADISKSMTLEDVAPTRLSSMRDAASAIAARAGAMPISLIVFAGDAFLVSPPAFDKQLFNNTIAKIEYGMIETEGSNPTRALSLASSVIEGSGLLHSRVFLMTDTGGITDKTTAAINNLQISGHQVDLVVFGNGAGATGAEWNLQAAAETSRHTRSTLIRSNALGEIDLDSLNLAAGNNAKSTIEPSAIAVFSWKNFSHWLLLAVIPLFLIMFYRELH